MKRALAFVIFLGMVSLFADVTYEGARSITGPFLATLGASAAVVGTVAGAGELLGQALRLASGYLADRTRAYWTLTLVGYGINLAAVPLLALAGRWEIAALLMLLERTGKAIRTPSRDAMLSHAAGDAGAGRTFGLHEAMDQVGALTGPLVVAFTLARTGSHRTAFAWLAVPAILALITLLAARHTFPHPQIFERRAPSLETAGLPRVFWLYVLAAGLLGAGYSDFPLIAYHLQRTHVAPETWVPLFYAAAMGVDALAALAFGRLFDRFGIPVLMLAAILSAASAPLAYFGGRAAVMAGMALWGAGMGAQESILKAAVAGMAPPGRRGSAYGIFNTGYGVMWFLGSALMGVLYTRSVAGLVVFSVTMQLLSVPVFFAVGRRIVSRPE